MKKFTLLLLLLVLLVSCAKKTEELVSPDSPAGVTPTSESDRLKMNNQGGDPKFDQAAAKTAAVSETTPVASEAKTTVSTAPAPVVVDESAEQQMIAEIEPVVKIVEPATAAPEPKAVTPKPVAVKPVVDKVTITPPLPKPEVVFTDSSFQDYMIKRDDYLSKIAKKEYGDWLMWKKIYEWNREEIGPNPNLIYPYRFIDLLKPTAQVKNCPVEYYSYKISRGETLWSIAGKVFDDELAWIILYFDNEDMIENNAGIINPGMELKLRKKLDPCS
ncbi:MAG: LysM peptidoglycan-binding domain-containing protein [Candidatus Neomarinimicrobiota bacterium]